MKGLTKEIDCRTTINTFLFITMNLSFSLQSKRVAALFCGIFFLCCLYLPEVLGSKQLEGEIDVPNQLQDAANNPESKELNANTTEAPFEFDFETYVRLKGKNVRKANVVLKNLYSETTEDFAGTPDNPDDDLLVGAQAGYYAKPGTEQAYGPLVLYGRVWTYDTGMALSLAVYNEDPTSHNRLLWLVKHAQNTFDPENPGKSLFAGWPFSKNQAYLGDNWTDCRFITGANACALLGMAKYITSKFFQELDQDQQDYYLKLFRRALAGILYHIESEGPNEGLVAAGWTINVLKEVGKTDYSYGEILSMAGYEKRTIKGYPYPLKRIRARNIVTEHCANVLALLNYTLEYYDILLEDSTVYTYDELAEMRLKLRESIFDKLYDREKGHFITGRSESGVSSEHASISNASWLVLVLRLDDLTTDQVTALSKSLLYTIDSFTKDFKINGGTYFGAHYFQDGFEDPYVVKADLHSDGLHVEGTCRLINSLLMFSNAFPEDPNAPFFHVTALKLWQSLQHLIDDYGFIYASTSLKDVTEPLESSVSAIWYLRTCNFFDANPKWYKTFR